MMLAKDGIARTDMRLEFDGKLSLLFLSDQVWFNLLEKFSSFPTPAIPLVSDGMVFVFSVLPIVPRDQASKLVVQRTDSRIVNHPKHYLQLLTAVCLGSILTGGDMEFVNADTSLSVKQSCDISQVHTHLLSECWNGGEFGGTPDRTTPSQATAKAVGVCNEHVPPSKEKICSVLHGNMQSAAEMTAPSDMYRYNISESNKQDQRYSDWDILNIAQSDVISAAEYPWRQVALNVVASGRELRINSGDSAIIKLAKARITNAIRTFNNSFSSDLYSDGALANQINGLQAVVSDLGTGTVGGIVSGNFAFWLSQIRKASTVSVTVSATTIENDMMLPLWLLLDRGPEDQPDLIVMSNEYYSFFEASQVSLKRYNDKMTADAGFITLKYKSADVLFDGNSGIPATHGYFLNTQYLKLAVHKDADLEIMDDMRPINQDGSVTPILWMGNLICSNRHQQGLILA
jgi:hypothetical protein